MIDRVRLAIQQWNNDTDDAPIRPDVLRRIKKSAKATAKQELRREVACTLSSDGVAS